MRTQQGAKKMFDLLLFYFLFIDQVSASCVVNGTTYKEDNKWVDKIGQIEYQCIANGGIKPTACAPNGLSIVEAPGTWNDKYFKYQCILTSDYPPRIFFHPIACIDYLGREFTVGQEFIVQDNYGSKQYKCSNETGKVTFTKTANTTGCILNATFVPFGTVIQNNGFVQTCVENTGVYSLKTTACVFGNNTIGTAKWKMINQDYYTCKAVNVTAGSYILEKLENYLCNGHKLGDTWIEGSLKKMCELSTTYYQVYILDKGCFNTTNKESLDANGLLKRAPDGSAYYCDPAIGFVYLNYSITTCRLPDGTQIYAQYKSGYMNGIKYYCSFNFHTSTSTLRVWECLIDGTNPPIYASTSSKGTKVSEGVAYICQQVDGKWLAVQMSEAEYKSLYGSSNAESISANGGGGSGLAGATTKTTTTPTTTTLPTTIKKTTTLEPTTTVEAENSSTVLTTSPITTTEITTQPLIDTTALMSTETSTVASIQLSTESQSVHPTEITVTTTRNCNNILRRDVCEMLQPICKPLRKLQDHNHSSHSSEEWCDEEGVSSEACEKCDQFLRSSAELVKSLCRKTCETCSQGLINPVPVSAFTNNVEWVVYFTDEPTEINQLIKIAKTFTEAK